MTGLESNFHIVKKAGKQDSSHSNSIVDGGLSVTSYRHLTTVATFLLRREMTVYHHLGL